MEFDRESFGRRRPGKSTRTAAAGAILAVVGVATLLGCKRETTAPESASPAAVVPERSAAGQNTPTPKGDGDVLEDLRRKLQPDGVTPAATSKSSGPATTAEGASTTTPAAGTARGTPEPAAPTLKLDEAALTKDAEVLAGQLAAALQSGKLDDVRKTVTTLPELEAILSEGVYQIMAGNVVPQSHRRLENFMKLIEGKKTTHRMQSGRLSTTGGRPNYYRKVIPVMSNAVLELEVDGTVVLVKLQQLFWVDGKWKIFQVGA